jgi:hypothetical protein
LVLLVSLRLLRGWRRLLRPLLLAASELVLRVLGAGAGRLVRCVEYAAP